MNHKTSQKSLFSLWHCHLKPFGHFMGYDAVFPSVKQNLMEMHGSAIEKLQITYNMHNNNHQLRNNTEGYGCKTD